MNEKVTFTMLKNNYIWNYKDSTETFYKIYGEEVIGLLLYLDINTNRLGECLFTIEDFLNCFNITPRSGAGKSIERVRNILDQLEKINIILDLNMSVDKVRRNDLLKCKLSVPFNRDGEKNTEFFVVNHDVYEKIISSDTELNKLRLINIYCYIVSRIRRRKENEKDPKYQMGGKAEYCHPSYEQITKDLGISESTFNTYLTQLNEWDLIFYDNIGVLSKNKIKKSANNVYTIHPLELEYALRESKNYYVNLEGWRLIKKDTSELNKTIKGLKGKIASERNKGNDTTKLEKKLNNKLVELEKLISNQVEESKADVIKRINSYLAKINEESEMEVYLEEFFEDFEDNVWDLSIEELREVEKRVLDFAAS